MNSGKIREMVSCLIRNGYSKKDIKSFIHETIIEKDLPEEKTIEQWLKEGLTPEQFENATNHKWVSDWETTYDELSGAIYFGFKWNEMPEGCGYWNNKVASLRAEGK